MREHRLRRAVFVPIVIALSVATLGFWLSNGVGATFACSAAAAILTYRLSLCARPRDWAFAYNVAAVPLAALDYLDPLVAGAAMAFPSVSWSRTPCT